MTGGERDGDGTFVAFGPEQARKARAEAGLPEPVDVVDVPNDAGLLRRIWAFLTQVSGEDRKLWARDRRAWARGMPRGRR